MSRAAERALIVEDNPALSRTLTVALATRFAEVRAARGFALGRRGVRAFVVKPLTLAELEAAIALEWWWR